MDRSPSQISLPKKKVLLVIGNGFDLDMGLRTSYMNFVESDFFKVMVDSSIPNPVEIFEGVDEEKMQLRPNGLALHVQKKAEHKNWVDLEECIREYCELQCDKHADRELLRKELFAMRYMLYHYLASSVNYSFEERNQFFKNHISYRLLDGIVHGEVDYQIWDFNYTFTCETILEWLHVDSKDIQNRLHYIHGQLRKEDGAERWPIVLGSNSTSKIQNICPSAIKCNTSNYYDNARTFKDEISKASVIVFMGHSMGSTDSPYFRDMLVSPKMEAIAIITKSENSLDEFRANINEVTDNLYAQLKERPALREISFVSDGYYEPFNTFNSSKWKEFDDIMNRIMH